MLEGPLAYQGHLHGSGERLRQGQKAGGTSGGSAVTSPRAFTVLLVWQLRVSGLRKSRGCGEGTAKRYDVEKFRFQSGPRTLLRNHLAVRTGLPESLPHHVPHALSATPLRDLPFETSSPGTEARGRLQTAVHRVRRWCLSSC